MTLNLIVAVADDLAIGRDGNQPFFVSDDLRRFKSLTMGHPIIMGRKTFEALPKGALPGRRNIVVTRNSGFSAPDTEVAASIEDAIKLAAAADEAFVIGGASIYRQSLPYVDKLYITRIFARAEGADTFFPAIDDNWIMTSEAPVVKDSKSGLSYQFVEYSRRR